MAMIDIPSSLIERIKTRQTVLVVGLGCGELAQLPGWNELTERLTNWLDEESRKEEVRALVKAGRQAAATAYLRAKLPEATVTEVLNDAYPAGRDVPAVFRKLGEIPWRGIVATSFDDVWDRAFSDHDKLPTKQFLPSQVADMASYKGRFLLHLFGAAATPQSVCISPDDVRRKVTPTGIGPFLDEVYRKRSFVFLGFRPGDSDLTMLSERLLGANAHEHEHFLFFPGGPGLEADLLRAEFGYTPVPYEGGIDDLISALAEAWAPVAHESRPSDDDIEAWLEIWHRDPSDHEPREVLERTEARLRDDRSWDRLVELLLGRMELLGDPADQVHTLREVARIFEAEKDSPEQAFTALLTAFSQAPSDRHILADLLRVTGKAEKWNDLLTDYAELVKGITDKDESVHHWLQIAHIYGEEINRDDYAIASFQHVLSLEPKQREALDALQDLLRKHERWAELGPVLETSAAIETDQQKEVELRLQLADLQETRLGQADLALGTYERVLDLDRESTDAVAALERQYRKLERWKDLARVLERKADLTIDPAEAAAVRRERADLLADKVGDTEAAIVALEAVVDEDAQNRGALRSLEKLYDKAGRQSDYLRTLERLCDVAESDGERLLLLRRLAAEWEARPDGLDRAADALEQVLQIDVRDQDAFAALGRVYRAAKRGHALVEAIIRQIDAADAPARKRELYVMAGKLHEEELRDLPRALEAYASAESLGDDREDTFAALGRLHEAQGSFQQAAEALDKLAEAARKAGRDATVLTDVCFRAARLYGDKLDDKAAAEERYAKALGATPGHLESLLALANLYRQRGEHLRCAKMMLEAEEKTQNRIEKTRLLFEAGVLHEDQLADEAKATSLYARALALDPEHVEAGRRLAGIYQKKGQWAELESVLDMLARKVDKGDAGQAVDVHLSLASAAKSVGNAEKALKGYEAAYALDPQNLTVLRGFAELRLERKDWAEAKALLKSILGAHASDLPAPEVVAWNNRLGECEVALGNADEAIGWYEKALVLDANHKPSLEAIARLHEQKGDHAALVLGKRTLVNLATGDEKAKLLEEIGDIYAGKLENPTQAIASYQQALELAPTSRRILHKLQDLYAGERHWKATAEVVVKLADLETNPTLRSKYTYAAATIRRDELDDNAGAIDLFNRALDDAPDMVKAYDAIERILTDAADWKELARNVRKMIKRLPAEGLNDLRLRLWQSLGELSLQHLDDKEMATTAFEVAATLDRSNVQRHELLADLYMQAGPDKADKAIAEHQLLLAKNPDRLGSYRALAKLYADVGARDKLWCVAATLAFLKKADPELVAIYEKGKTKDLPAVKRRFNDELWQKVIHPEEDRFIDAIFMLVGHYMAATSAQQHGQVGLRRKDRVDVARDERMASRAVRYACTTLDQPPPDVFFQGDDKQGLALMNFKEKESLYPALVVGSGLAQKTSEHEVVFEVAKRLAYLRSERFVRFALPSTAHVDIALRAALAVGGTVVGHGGHNGEVDKLSMQLRRMVPKPTADQLAIVGRKLLQARGEVIDLSTWLAGTDLTASRVGFILSADLPAAARVLNAEPAAISPLPVKQRFKDLLAFSVSEDYFAVRKFLGLEASV